MSGLAEVTGPRSGSDDSDVVSSGSQDDQIDRSGHEERKLSEKLVQFMKTVKDIDDVLDTWVGSSSNEVFVKTRNKEVVCLRDLETSALDEIMLDIDSKKLFSFSSYIAMPDSVLCERLCVSILPRLGQRPVRGTSTSSEDKQTAPINETNCQMKLEGRGKPSSIFGLNFLKWRRSSESTLSTGNTKSQSPLDVPACSSNIMNYAQRRNSDTSLRGHGLSKLRKHENIRNRSSPTGSTSEIAHIFQKLTKQVSKPDGLKRNNSLETCSLTDGLKRNNSLETCSLTDGSYRDDCSSSSSSLHRYKSREFAEADVDDVHEYRSAKDYKTMYSSAPNISSFNAAQMDNSFNSECDISSNVKVGQNQPGMFRSGSLKVLNFFRNILPGEKVRTTQQPVALPRRLSMDSQLTVNRLPTFGRDKIKHSKRTIKINRPDQSHAMYISAADTLGGLPENEEISFPHRHLRTQINFLEENINNYLNTGRRASCPVILETEESDECLSSRRFRLLSVKPKATDFLSENSDTPESDETVHSFDDNVHEQPPCCKAILGSDECEHDVTDSTPSSGSDSEADECAAPSLLEGVTFIVNKRPRPKEGQQKADVCGENKHSSSDVSSDDRDRPNNTSPEDNISSNDKLRKRPNKLLKKKKRTERHARTTHSAGRDDTVIIHTSKGHNLASTRSLTDKASLDSSQQSVTNFTMENELQGERTLNEHNNNSLVWNDSSISINSLVRENGSSSYFSDISSADN